MIKNYFVIVLMLFTAFGFSQAIAYTPPNLIQCEGGTVNFTQQNQIILGDQDPDQYTVGYYLTEAQAAYNVSPIVNPATFSAVDNQIIYARVTNTLDATFAVTSFSINTISPVLFPGDQTGCEPFILYAPPGHSYYTGPGGTGNFIPNGTEIPPGVMTVYERAIYGGCVSEGSFQVMVYPTSILPLYDVSACTSYTLPDFGSQQYYTGPNGTGTMLPAGYVISSSMTVHAISTSGPLSCIAEQSFNVTIGSIEAQQPLPLKVCDTNLNGINLFNLDTSIAGITQGQPNVAVSFHETLLDAQAGTDPIMSPYINTTPYNQIVFAAMASTDGDCNSVVALSLIVNACTENTISGTIRFDAEQNGCDLSDSTANYIRVANYNGGNISYAYTNAFGYYNFTNIQEGVNITSVPVSGLPINFNVVAPATQTFNISGIENTLTADFCITAPTPVNDAEIDIQHNGNAVPGFGVFYTLRVYNSGNTALSGTVTMDYDLNSLDFIDANPNASQAGNTLSFTFSDLAPTQHANYNIGFLVKAPPSANLGDILTFNANVTTDQIDENPANNLMTYSRIIVNAFDPNDISVREGEFINPQQADDYLHYTLRFQNTGTSPAVNVKIQNVLSEFLDWSTFTPTGASHNYFAEQNGANVIFNFEDINLPANALDEAGSNGYITYKIKPISDFSLGDIISATAFIYFDFNVPIMTNTVNTQIQILNISQHDLKDVAIFPNPASDKIIIRLNNDDHIGIAIYDVLGKMVIETHAVPHQNETSIDISKLQPGLYFIKIYSNGKAMTQKLIVD